MDLKFKGTKGEWNFAQTQPFCIKFTNPKHIEILFDGFNNGNFSGIKIEEAEANAKLIATAPELLSTLEDAYIDLEHEIEIMPNKSDEEKLFEWKKLIEKAVGKK